MGISTKKSTTNQTSNSTTQNQSQNAGSSTSTGSTTRTNPGFVTDAVRDLTGQIGGALGGDPTRYVAPASAGQQGAFAAIQGLGGEHADYDAARGAAGGVLGQRASAGQVGHARDVTGESLLTGLDDYFNPYDANVRQVALADNDEAAGRTTAALKAQGALNSAFGGSRWGLQEADTAGQLSRARGALDANLLHTGFTTAADLSDRDATRRQAAGLANQGADESALGREQQVNLANAGWANAGYDRDLSAGGLFSSIGTASGANDRANIASMMDVGGVQRGIDAEFRQAPLNVLSTLAPLQQSNPFGLFNNVENTASESHQGTQSGTSSTQETIARILRENPSLWEQFGSALETGSKIAAMF